MTEIKWAWTAYIIAWILSLAYKWARYVRTGKSLGKSIGCSTGEWFFEASLENGVSWVTTISSVFVVGGIYIDRLIVGTWFSGIPVHWSIAALLASLTEFWAPDFAKWLLKKVPGQNTGDTA